MRDLAAFDLDGTLIPGDSFGQLVRRKLPGHPRLLAAAVARRLGLVDRSRFAEIAHRLLTPQLGAVEFVDALVEGLAATALRERLALVRRWRDKGAATLLLSASPQEYVVPLGARLGIEFAAGSTWRDGIYNHLYGVAKLLYVEREFPADRWRRAFAIADRDSDEPFLAAFECGRRVASISRLRWTLK